MSKIVEVRDMGRTVEVRDMSRTVEVRDMSCSYIKDGERLKVLENIDMNVEENEFVTIVGPSGCGKSTLLRVLAGLEIIDSGNVLIENQDVTIKRSPVCYMLQKDLLMPWRTLLTNVLLPVEVAGGNVKEARGKIKSLIKEFGLEGFENFLPSELSGGMRQRAALLRTYSMEGNLMLLDEPFGALDAVTRMNLQDWLLKIWERHRKTVIFVTHDIDEAVLLSDKVYVISGKPGHISAEILIDFERPRNRDMLLSEEFLGYKRSILEGF